MECVHLSSCMHLYNENLLDFKSTHVFTGMRDTGSLRETKTGPFFGNISLMFTLEPFGADKSKYVVY